MNRFNKITLAAACLATGASAFAAPVAIQNGYVLAGVSDYGTLGSNGTTSPGILFDKTGAGNYGVNDFLTPGDPFEGFYVTSSAGSAGSNNDGDSGFGLHSPTALSATSATWTGSSGAYGITNTYTLTTASGRSEIAIHTVLTNTSGSDITGLEFLRTLDPDPDVNAFGSYFTNNTVVNSSTACGSGPDSGQTICIGAAAFNACAASPTRRAARVASCNRRRNHGSTALSGKRRGHGGVVDVLAGHRAADHHRRARRPRRAALRRGADGRVVERVVQRHAGLGQRLVRHRAFELRAAAREQQAHRHQLRHQHVAAREHLGQRVHRHLHALGLGAGALRRRRDRADRLVDLAPREPQLQVGHVPGRAGASPRW
jgi:hypothetical protein